MKYSNSMQYLPINKQIKEINLYSYSQSSNHSANGYEPPNTNYTKNIIQRNNSATSLTAQNYQIKNILSAIPQNKKTTNYKPIYSNIINTNVDKNIGYISPYYQPKINKGLKRYKSSENFNILNLPYIGKVEEQQYQVNNVSIYNSKPTNPTNNIIHINTNKNIIRKNNVSKIPHPKFPKQKVIPKNQNIVNYKYKYNNYQ